jgi:hypothetical protein
MIEDRFDHDRGANPATAPAAMAADNSNMNSPIVILPDSL